MKKLIDSDDPQLATMLFNGIFNNAVDGIILMSANGIVQKINPAAAKLFGYSSEEVIGQNIKMLMPEPHKSQHDEYIDRYHQTGEKKIIGIGREVSGLRKNGTMFPFHLSVSEIHIEDQTLFAGIIHDMSALKSKELELDESRKKLRAVFETAVDGIIIIDAAGLIQMLNPASAMLFGYPIQDLLGKNVSMLMPDYHSHQHNSYLNNYHKTRQSKIIGVGRELAGLRKDGSTFPFNLSISEIKVGKKVFFAGIIHDLSEQKTHLKEIEDLNKNLEEKVVERTQELKTTVQQLLLTNQQLNEEVSKRKHVEATLRQTEAEIRSALEKEQELNEMKSNFVSMASHEFRTPLSTILSSVSLIQRYQSGEQQVNREKHIRRIKNAVNNLTSILDDFLSLGKLEEGKIEAKSETFNWADFIKDIVTELSGMLASGQSIQIDTSPKIQSIKSDAHLLKNVLFNLLSNAIKYSKPDKNIICRSFLEKEWMVIEVIDQGIGIPEREQQHLFKRFFRASNAETIQGTGLGLNIIKQYLILLKGKIRFKSKVGVGSTFTIYLPITPAHEVHSNH